MQIDNRKQHLERVQTFLNSNLCNYFKKKDYSIDGIPTAKDVMGDRYKTYSIFSYDCCPDTRMDYVLEEFIRLTNQIINAITLAKSAEKPEGRPTEVRKVYIHWRRYPEVSFNEDFNNPKAKITFRVSSHHKSLKEEDQ